MKKAVCILGSPRKDGNTATICNEIIRGMRDQDIETAVFQLSDLTIGYCCGCKTCDVTGVCVQQDDVANIVPAMLAADGILVASPSYWGDVTGQMKVFIDRCTPYCNTNPARLPVPSTAKGVAIAVRAGGNKKENMDLVGTIEHFLGHLDIPLTAHFTAEDLNTSDNLTKRSDVLTDAYAFGASLSF